MQPNKGSEELEQDFLRGGESPVPEDIQGQAEWDSETQPQMSLFVTGQLDQATFKGPFQFQQFYNSMNVIHTINVRTGVQIVLVI